MLDLIDFGCLKVRPETALAIDVAVAMRNGDISKHDLVREILDEWAKNELSKASLLVETLQRHGLIGDKTIRSGKPGEPKPINSLDPEATQPMKRERP